MERTYREMLLSRSGADRLKMGCSMFTTARSFVVARALEKNPGASPALLRRALFLHLYAGDFDARERAKIAERLDADAADSAGALS
jgi:hypothetical protein